MMWLFASSKSFGFGYQRTLQHKIKTRGHYYISHNKGIWLTEALKIEVVLSYRPPKMHWSGDVPEAVVRFIQWLVWWKCAETKGCFELCQKANIGWMFIAGICSHCWICWQIESYVLIFYVLYLYSHKCFIIFTMLNTHWSRPYWSMHVLCISVWNWEMLYAYQGKYLHK